MLGLLIGCAADAGGGHGEGDTLELDDEGGEAAAEGDGYLWTADCTCEGTRDLVYFPDQYYCGDSREAPPSRAIGDATDYVTAHGMQLNCRCQYGWGGDPLCSCDGLMPGSRGVRARCPGVDGQGEPEPL